MKQLRKYNKTKMVIIQWSNKAMRQYKLVDQNIIRFTFEGAKQIEQKPKRQDSIQ